MHDAWPSDAAALLDAVRVRTFDPLPDGQPASRRRWFSVPGDVPAARLQRLVKEGRAAGRFVHYVQNTAPLPSTRRFRVRSTAASPVVVPAPGVERVRGDAASRSILHGTREAEPEAGWYSVELAAPPGVPVEFAVAESCGDWEAWNGTAWVAVASLEGAEEGAYGVREPTVAVRARRGERVWELPAPVLGRVVVTADREPRLTVGESPEEATASSEDQESRTAVIRRADGRWATVHEHGLRYASVRGADAAAIEVEAAAHPVERRAGFLCSDPRLNDVWVTSAYTLRQCMHELMIDGIKRDRMPWSGDQALSTIVNAHTFADAQIIEDGLSALGRVDGGYINGIADYSMWWVINLGVLCRYFGGARRLAAHRAALDAVLQQLLEDTGEDGVFRPRVEGAAFERPVFIDWSVSIDPTRVATALQLLWYWTLQTAAELLVKVDGAEAARLRQRADRLGAALTAAAWDEGAGLWRAYLDEPGESSPHAHLFAALSGHPIDDGRNRVDQLEQLLRSSTPFIAGFALRALGECGAGGRAVDHVRTSWGAMLDRGARTFWEEFPTPGRQDTEMYGRRFGRSLCHAWAAGPAALLPEIVCGARPQADGWRVFEVRPALGTLDWAAAVVPTPSGTLFIRADARETRVDVPSGLTLRIGEMEVEGPATARLDPSGSRLLSPLE